MDAAADSAIVARSTHRVGGSITELTKSGKLAALGSGGGDATLLRILYSAVFALPEGTGVCLSLVARFRLSRYLTSWSVQRLGRRLALLAKEIRGAADRWADVMAGTSDDRCEARKGGGGIVGWRGRAVAAM